MINKLTEAINQDLQEETTSAAISYLPGAFATTKSLVRSLSRIKRKWNVDILEDEDEYRVVFEDALAVTVPKQYFEDFNKNVVMVTGVTQVDLKNVINETIMEVNNNAYKKLYNVLTIDLKQNQKVKNSMILMNQWLKTFPKSRIIDTDEKVAIRLDRFDKDAKVLVGTFKKTYQDDIGKIDSIIDAIENGRSMGSLGDYVYLVGVKIYSVYEDVHMALELCLNMSMMPVQNIFIKSEIVISELENYRTVNTLYRKVFPVGQMFEPSIFGNIKDIIEEVEEDV